MMNLDEIRRERLFRETYRCSHCRGVFPKGWSDAEALEECVLNGWADTPTVLVCDDCYQDYMAARAIPIQ